MFLIPNADSHAYVTPSVNSCTEMGICVRGEEADGYSPCIILLTTLQGFSTKVNTNGVIALVVSPSVGEGAHGSSWWQHFTGAMLSVSQGSLRVPRNSLEAQALCTRGVWKIPVDLVDLWFLQAILWSDLQKNKHYSLLLPPNKKSATFPSWSFL